MKGFEYGTNQSLFLGRFHVDYSFKVGIYHEFEWNKYYTKFNIARLKFQGRKNHQYSL